MFNVTVCLSENIKDNILTVILNSFYIEKKDSNDLKENHKLPKF